MYSLWIPTHRLPVNDDPPEVRKHQMGSSMRAPSWPSISSSRRWWIFRSLSACHTQTQRRLRLRLCPTSAFHKNTHNSSTSMFLQNVHEMPVVENYTAWEPLAGPASAVDAGGGCLGPSVPAMYTNTKKIEVEIMFHSAFHNNAQIKCLL